MFFVMLEAGTLPALQDKALVSVSGFQAGCLFLMADGCSAGKVSLSGATFLGPSTMGTDVYTRGPHIPKRL